MYSVRDRTACGSLISERPGWVICACSGPRGPPLIIAYAQEGDDEEEAAGESVCVYTRRADCVSVQCICVCNVYSAPVYIFSYTLHELLVVL